MTANQCNGVKNQLTPDNHAMALIDHQYPQHMSVTSRKHSIISHDVTALSKAAKVFNAPQSSTVSIS